MIKICGLHQPEDLILAENLGADVLGMIYAVPESPRNNSAEELEHLFSLIKRANSAILFRNSSLEAVKPVLKHFKPSIVHLCGAETQAFRFELKSAFPTIKIWQSCGLDVDQPLDATKSHQVKDLLKDSSIDRVVLDSKKSGKTGGTGLSLPLTDLKRELELELRELVIAGGLNPHNLESTLTTLNPFGVDVSSGIESIPGRKDHDKLRQFINTYKQVS